MKRLLSILIAIVSVGLSTVSAQDAKYKALFIYNFTKQIEWPASEKSGDFVICVVNHNELFSQLSSTVAGKKVGNQDIVVKKLKSIDEVTKCHILFLASSVSNASNMESIVNKLGASACLILTERQGALKNGSCINFLIRDDKLKFEMNSDAIASRKLQVSSSLTNLAVPH